MFKVAGGALSERLVERSVMVTVFVWFSVSCALLIRPLGILVTVPVAVNDCEFEAFWAVRLIW